MANPSALYKLLAWLSPSYPIGAYTYSHGLEYAVEAGFIKTSDDTKNWIKDIVSEGAGFSDAVFLQNVHDAVVKEDKHLLIEACELASCFSATRELSLETHAQGDAFLEITHKAWPCSALDWLCENWPGPYAYPVLVGVAAAGHEIDKFDAVHAFLHGVTANLVSAATRLVPLGQTDGQKIISNLEQVIHQTADKALGVALDDVSNNAIMIDICSMKHETQHTRLFRS